MTWRSWDAFWLNGIERNILDIFNATSGARVSGNGVAPLNWMLCAAAPRAA